MTTTLCRTRPALLHRLAHARSGDKGNRLNIAVIAHEPRFYPVLQDLLTPGVVQRHFAHRRPTGVVRYDLPRLQAFNFVLDDVLDGGVNSSTGLDGHGKSLSYHLLGLVLQVPETLLDKPAPHFIKGDA